MLSNEKLNHSCVVISDGQRKNAITYKIDKPIALLQMFNPIKLRAFPFSASLSPVPKIS